MSIPPSRCPSCGSLMPTSRPTDRWRTTADGWEWEAKRGTWEHVCADGHALGRSMHSGGLPDIQHVRVLHGCGNFVWVRPGKTTECHVCGRAVDGPKIAPPPTSE